MAEIIAIPVDHIMPNPDQPRKYISPEDTQAMAESLKEEGQKTEVRVLLLTDAEKTQFAPCQYMLIGGERRWRGAKLAGLPTLNAVIRDIRREDLLLESMLDNQSKAISWLEWGVSLEKLYDNGNGIGQDKLAAKFEVDQGTISKALTLMEALTPASRDLIYARGIKLKSIDKVKQKPIRALAALNDPEKVEKALPVLLDRKMTEAEAKKLVTHIQAGNPAETYGAQPAAKLAASQPNPKPAPVAIDKASATPQKSSPTAKAIGDRSETSTPKGSQQAPPSQADPKMGAGEASSSLGTGTTKSRTSAGSLGAGENAIWDGLAGISVIAQIRAKIKKGERPTWGESFILLIDLLWRGLHWLSKVGWKLAKWLTKELWKTLKFTFKSILNALGPAVKKTVGFVLGLALLIGFVWLAWDIHEHGWLHPVKWVGAKATSAIRSQFEGPASSASNLPPAGISPTPQMGIPVATAVPTAVSVVSAPTVAPTLEPTAIPTPEIAKHKKVKQADAMDELSDAVSTPMPTATVVKKDVVADTAGSVAKQMAPDLATDAAKKLFGL